MSVQERGASAHRRTAPVSCVKSQRQLRERRQEGGTEGARVSAGRSEIEDTNTRTWYCEESAAEGVLKFCSAELPLVPNSLPNPRKAGGIRGARGAHRRRARSRIFTDGRGGVWRRPDGYEGAFGREVWHLHAVSAARWSSIVCRTRCAESDVCGRRRSINARSAGASHRSASCTRHSCLLIPGRQQRFLLPPVSNKLCLIYSRILFLHLIYCTGKVIARTLLVDPGPGSTEVILVPPRISSEP